MKPNNNSPQGFKLTRGAAALLLAAGSLLSAGIAQANTAAGVTLTNSVTVDYDDAGGTAQTQETASVSVTVDHLPSAVWGTAPADQTTNSGSPLPSAYTITLTNTGNGGDTYAITDNTTQSCTTGTLTAQSFAFTTPVTLGATVASAASAIAATTITTPDDSNTADGIVRDIAVGDTIVTSPGGDELLVSAISENDAGSGNTVITFATTPLAAAVNIGDQVGQQISVSYGATGNAGTTSSGSDDCDHTHELNAAGSTATGGNTDTDVDSATWITNVEGTTLAVIKYVRNVTTPAKNTGAAAINYAGVDYFGTGVVSGNPTETLEYLVVITNSSGGDATDVEFNDTLPPFTTYIASSNAVDTNGDETFDVTAEDEADTTGIVTQSGSSIQVFAGTGGSETTDLGGGITDLATAPNNKSAVRYQVTID